MTHGSLFSGIGGFDLASEWMGWENIFHCEWNDFGQKVLKHYWPKAISYHDITKTDFTIHRGRIDILTGGFPCQPYSMAGKRKGKEDERHLWPEMLRAIKEIQPRWVVGENVYGLVNWSGGLVFHEVQTDLEASGYEVFPYVLPAVSVNAPHRRDRVWFVAYSKSARTGENIGGVRGIGNGCGDGIQDDTFTQNTFSNGCLLGEFEQERTKVRQFGNTCTGSSDGFHLSKGYAPHPNSNGLYGGDCQHEVNASEGREYAQCNFEQMGRDVADTDSKRREKCNISGKSKQSQFLNRRINENRNYWQNFPTQSPICIGDDGLSSRLDGITFSKWRNESIKAAGNAIVPQVALQIFKTIQQYEALPRMADTL